MQKAINRFWDWLFHPSIRWYHFPKGKSVWFRYPSPDYRTPFDQSKLNVRYAKPIKAVTQNPKAIFMADGPAITLVQKLRDHGLLEPGQNSEEQIEKAKQKFQQKFGVSADTKVYRDDLGMAKMMPEGTNRQSYRMFAQNQFKQLREQKKYYNDPNNDRRYAQQPESVWLESLDMFSHPNFQQSRIEVNYKLDNFANQNAKRGYIEVRKGEKTFWKALDDSNDIKNVEKVQKAIGDDKPTDFTLRDTKIEFVKDADGNVVDIKPQTKGL